MTINAAPRLYINGKFYSGATNGVHRVADRLIRELDRRAIDGGVPAGWDMRLLLPTIPNWAPDFKAITVLPQRWGHTQGWEQAILPRIARDGVLASFANLAPIFHTRKLTMVHDAQFRISPDSYPRKLRWGYRALVPSGARSSRAVVTVSDYARDSLATFGIARHDTTHVIRNGADHILDTAADLSVLTRNGLAPGGYALLFGSDAHYKNAVVVFSAFAAQAPSSKTLVVVGSTREVLVSAGLAPPADACFVGGVDDGALRALYEGAHCLLYPSRTEGFGLPPVEAMLCGCPVVAAPAGAMPEICGDAVVYARMDEAREWANAVAALTATKFRAAKVAAGRARASEFTWAAAGQGLIALLAELLHPSKVDDIGRDRDRIGSATAS